LYGMSNPKPRYIDGFADMRLGLLALSSRNEWGHGLEVT